MPDREASSTTDYSAEQILLLAGDTALLEGTRIVSYRGLPCSAPHGRALGVAVYRATRRADGVLTWWCVDPAPYGYVWAGQPACRWTERAAERDAREYAVRHGLVYVEGVRHGQRVTSVDESRL